MSLRIFPSSVYSISRIIENALEDDEYKYDLKAKKQRSLILEQAAIRHSVDIETKTRYPFFTNSKRKRNKEDINRYKLAWQKALGNIRKDQNISAENLTKIAALLAPNQSFHPINGYRIHSARVTGSTYIRCGADSVPKKMGNLINKLGGLTLPLEKAIYAHFHILRIHPFEDGNGRTARIVQDAILCANGYTPIPIPVDQRDIYMGILESGFHAHRDGKKDYLHLFSEYLVYNLWTNSKDKFKNVNISVKKFK